MSWSVESRIQNGRGEKVEGMGEREGGEGEGEWLREWFESRRWLADSLGRGVGQVSSTDNNQPPNSNAHATRTGSVVEDAEVTGNDLVFEHRARRDVDSLAVVRYDYYRPLEAFENKGTTLQLLLEANSSIYEQPFVTRAEREIHPVAMEYAIRDTGKDY